MEVLRVKEGEKLLPSVRETMDLLGLFGNAHRFS